MVSPSLSDSFLIPCFLSIEVYGRLSVDTATLSMAAGLLLPGAQHEGISGLLLLRLLSVLGFSVAIRGRTSLRSIPLRSIPGQVSF